MPKVRWVMLHSFVANFIHFPAVENFENRLRFDKVTDSLKVGTFVRHSVERYSMSTKCRTYKLSKESGFWPTPYILIKLTTIKW